PALRGLQDRHSVRRLRPISARLPCPSARQCLRARKLSLLSTYFCNCASFIGNPSLLNRTSPPAAVSFSIAPAGAAVLRAGHLSEVVMNMDLSHLLAGGAIVGLVTACWARIKLVAWRGINLLIQQIEVQDELTQTALVDYLVRHYKRSASYDKTYGAFNEHTRDGKYGMVPFELLGRRSIIFWRGWLPFFYTAGTKPQTNPANGGTAANNQDRIFCSLTFLRGFLDAEELIKSACDIRNAANWDVDLA